MYFSETHAAISTTSASINLLLNYYISKGMSIKEVTPLARFGTNSLKIISSWNLSRYCCIYTRVGAKRKLRHLIWNATLTASVQRQDLSHAKRENAELFLIFWVRKNQNMQKQTEIQIVFRVCVGRFFYPSANEKTLICLYAISMKYIGKLI